MNSNCYQVILLYPERKCIEKKYAGFDFGEVERLGKRNDQKLKGERYG
jgi:hypothetical protein